jgi:DNA mismatch repair protein MutS
LASLTKFYFMTPLMQQYQAIKAKYKDALILFRVGDFYEVFGEDAEAATKVFGGLFMSTKNKEGLTTDLSIPHHSLDTALHKLVKAGYRVAVCDQLEAPKAGPMKRGVTGLFP